MANQMANMLQGLDSVEGEGGERDVFADLDLGAKELFADAGLLGEISSIGGGSLYDDDEKQQLAEIAEINQ